MTHVLRDTASPVDVLRVKRAYAALGREPLSPALLDAVQSCQAALHHLQGEQKDKAAR